MQNLGISLQPVKNDLNVAYKRQDRRFHIIVSSIFQRYAYYRFLPKIAIFFLCCQRGHKSSFFKQAKSYPMFPCKEDRVKWDEYGEIIKPEDYLIPEANAPEEETKIKTVSLYQPRTTEYYTEVHLHCFLGKRYSS